MILSIKQTRKFLVPLSVMLWVSTEAYAVTPFTTNGTVGSPYSFNLGTMPGAAVNNGSVFQPVGIGVNPGGVFGPLAYSYRGLTFDLSQMVTGNPTTAGIFTQSWLVIAGTNVGGRYDVTFDISAAAAASSGGDDSAPAAPVCNCITLTSGSNTIDGGVVTMGHQVYPGSLTVGPLGAVLRLSPGAIAFFVGDLVLNGPLLILGDKVGDLTFLGKISGSGSLQIGTLTTAAKVTILGNNTRTGSTYVASEGYLFAAGNKNGATPLGSGDIDISGTASLTGNFPGNLVASRGSYLHTGASPGYASYGSLTMGAGSTYLQDIAGKVQANATTINGTAGTYSFANITTGLVIESGTTLTPRLSNLFSVGEPGYGSSIYIPVLGDRFRILTAAGGITGRFTTLTQPAELSSGTQMIALYNVNNGNSVDLAIAPTSYSTTLSSSTTNAKAVASVLDQLLGVNKAGTSSSAQDSLLYAVAGQNAANLPDFARSLAGEIHAASVATLPQTTQRVQQSVLARLGDYPMAPSQLNPALNNALLTGGISATNTSGLPTANMSTNPAVNPNAVNVTSAAVADGRAWGEIAYQRTERASNSAGNGYNSNLYQIVTGVDAYSNAELGLKLGAGIALSNTTVSANGGNSTIQQGSLFIYGKMPVLQDYVLDGMASVGLSSTNLSRNDPTGFTGGFSSKAVMGNEALVSVGLSRAFEYNDLRVTPYARLSYQYVGQNSYDEGSGAAALDIARFSGSALRGVIGVAAGSLNKDPLKDEYTYRANVAVGADTSGLLNPTLNTTLGGYSSSVTTATAGSAFVQVGLYGTVKISDNAYAYAGVSGEARTGQTLYGGSVGLRMAF
ncbi:Autotransporter beta-domain containing protein [Burkholderiaceae bacterium]